MIIMKLERWWSASWFSNVPVKSHLRLVKKTRSETLINQLQLASQYLKKYPSAPCVLILNIQSFRIQFLQVVILTTQQFEWVSSNLPNKTFFLLFVSDFKPGTVGPFKSVVFHWLVILIFHDNSVINCMQDYDAIRW